MRSASQVMEELIAKSKAGKAAKAMQKEEDLTETDMLDASFQTMLQGGELAALLKEKGSKHEEKKAQAAKAQDDGDAEFDRMRRELAFEARAKVRSTDFCRDVSDDTFCRNDAVICL